MRIFLTGSASHLAAALLPQLCAHAEISAVIGIDLKPTHYAHEKLSAHIADMRTPEIATLMRGCDALIHLAWQVLRGRMPDATMADHNLRGTQNVFEAARAARLMRLIHLSSVAVYGQGVALQESAPLNPLPRFLYAEHKATIEQWLTDNMPQALVLRPHIILGPHCQPLLKSLLRLPIYLRLPEPQARLQCIHEEDVARAIVSGLFGNARGAINLAAPGSYSVKEAILARHPYALPIPFKLARHMLTGLNRLSGVGGEPAWLEGARQTLTVDCSRARAELHWQAQYDVSSALRSI